MVRGAAGLAFVVCLHNSWCSSLHFFMVQLLNIHGCLHDSWCGVQQPAFFYGAASQHSWCGVQQA
jgi:hypothetical protein